MVRLARHAVKRTLTGPIVFVGLALALTWATSVVLTGGASDAGASPTRLLHASLVYAAAIGWQPLLALWVVRRFVDPEFVDHAGRARSRRYVWGSIALPIVLLASATAVDVLLGAPHTAADARVFTVDGGEVAVMVLAFLGVLAVLWLQASVEELAWRGYVLPRIMEGLGPWPGLFAHGMLWGACYAPVFLIAGDVAEPSRIASFVVTCGLLGVVLGWLRLASGSIATSVACNATLTICAGLPLVLQGASPLLGAVFEPSGWLPMLVLVALIVLRPPWRAAVAVPQRPVPEYLN